MCDKILSSDLSFPSKPTVSEKAREFIRGLLQRDPSVRFDIVQIKAHPFFDEINWEDLQLKKIIPPFTPAVKGETDIQNFDKLFTKETPRLSPEIPMAISDFEGFTYTSNSLISDNTIDIGEDSSVPVMG